MPHKLLLSFWATNLVLAFVAILTSAAEGNAQNLPKSIAVVKLSSDFSPAELERTIHHPTFAFPLRWRVIEIGY
jgi:hypothetical protein